MKKIGLTGGIGSGKSTVAEVFQALNVPVFVSDEQARAIQNEDSGVVSSIMALFGKDIYSGGKLDRAKLASIVFTDRKKLERLNAIVHPAVAKAFNDFAIKHSACPYVLKEAAIIFEHGLEKQLDAVITVIAPDEVRIRRVMERDRVSREDVQKRIANQLSQEEKAQRSDFVIVNDGKQLIVPQVLAIHEQLSR